MFFHKQVRTHLQITTSLFAVQIAYTRLHNYGNKRQHIVHFVLFLAVITILTGFKPVQKGYNFKENDRSLTCRVERDLPFAMSSQSVMPNVGGARFALPFTRES